jgi:hypothetical protein
MPANAWADYWLSNCVTSHGHSRGAAWLAIEEDFQKDLDASEAWITMAKACHTLQTYSRKLLYIA